MSTHKTTLFGFSRARACMVLVFLLLPSCARKPAAGGPLRLAILRFENLDQNPGLDWMGRAFSEIIWSELVAAPELYTISPARIRATDRAMGSRPVSAPGVSAELTDALAAGANRVGYGSYWTVDGRLEARLVLRDPMAQKDVAVLSATAGAGDIANAATALARQISSRAGQPASNNAQAWSAYAGALESGDTAVVERQAAAAIAADPNFGPPYRLLVQLEENGDPAQASQLAAKAEALPGLQPAERLRLQVAVAGLRGDRAAVHQGLAALVKLQPGDIDTWRLVAQSAFERRDFKLSVEAWKKVLAAQPDDAPSLNQLGYASVYAGDLSGAVAALRRYTILRPRDPNALDSLGDVHLIAGRLKEAEGFYTQAVKTDPHFAAGADWLKAAMARLMAGDVAGANEMAGNYAKALAAAGDHAVPLFQAEWLWMTGQHKAAYRALEGFANGAEAGRMPDAAARAYAQLVMWSLLEGDHAAGESMSLKASALAGPASRGEAAAVRFLALPPAGVEEWQARAARLAPLPAQQPLRDSLLAYALLLSRQFGPAGDVLQDLYDRGANSIDPQLPVLLAWCYLETGRAKDAAPLLQFNPVPPVRGLGLFTSFYFPRIYDLRARLADTQGRPDEAAGNRKLYTALSGSAEQ